MPSLSPDARFLGVDFQALWREIRQPWRQMNRWPLLSWLTPDPPVLLLQSDGRQSVWLGEQRQLKADASFNTRFTAIELPEDFVLRRQLSMPAMAESDIAQAVQLEARTISPFAVQDLALAYRARPLEQGAIEVEMVLVSRKQIAKYLAAQSLLPQMHPPEVWVRADKFSPIVLGGYGEDARQAYAALWRNVGYGLLLTASLLLAAIIVTPTAQLRLRGIAAVHSYEEIAQRTAPLVRQREALLQSAEKLGALSQVLADRIEPLRILDKLTEILPDDTSLQTFKLQGIKVTIVGTTANASALMQLLGSQSGLQDVRAPSAATRTTGANKESFAIDFSLDPKIFGVKSTVAFASEAAAHEIATPSIAAPVNAAGEAPASIPAVAAKGGPSFGTRRSRTSSSPASPVASPTVPTKPAHE